jgi:hypothetical protein
MTLQSADRQVGGRDINAHLYPLGRPVDMGEDAEMEAEGEEGPVSGAEGARLDREQGGWAYCSDLCELLAWFSLLESAG